MPFKIIYEDINDTIIHIEADDVDDSCKYNTED